MTETKNTVSDERLAHYVEHADLVGDNGTPAISTGELALIARELQSLRTTIPGGVGVKVKPLAWKPFTSDEDVSFMFAAAFGVRYEVFYKASDVAKIGIQVARMQHVDGLLIDDDDEETTTIIGYGKDLDAAYAIAQADYEQRIRSALTAAPSNPVVSDDDVAAALWLAEVTDAGVPHSTVAARTRSAFDDESESTKDKWRKFARAALSVKPQSDKP